MCHLKTRILGHNSNWMESGYFVSNGNKIKLYSKNQDVTNRFPELHNPPISKGTIIDSELISTDERGHPDFEACLARFNSLKDKNKIHVCAFDILFYRGDNVMHLPLDRRLELLEKELRDTEYYSKARSFEGSAIQLFEIVKSFGLEGIVLKRADSRYLSSRSPCEPGTKGKRSWNWQKVTNYSITHDILITGFSKRDYRWLIGKVERGIIRPLGTIELGVTVKARKMVWPKLQNSIIKENKDFVYVEPRISCTIKHRGYYKSGLMRLPVLEEIYL